MSSTMLALADRTLQKDLQFACKYCGSYMSDAYSSVSCDVSSAPLSELSPNTTTSVLERKRWAVDDVHHVYLDIV